MPTKKDDLLKRITSLEENVRTNTKKSSSNAKEISKIGKDIMDFQEGVGEAVIPFQRFTGYLTAAIMILAGIVIISITAAKGFDDPDLESHGYIIGGVLIGFGFLMAVIVYFWTGFVSTSRSGKVINAFMFEKQALTGK